MKKVKHKIFTVNQLIKKIGKFPRKKKLIMCHGTFDIVHPGHIRHLYHAKSKADLLLVSVTADKHIKKANYRPYIPQDLRAFNLASLEVVDYVLIDQNSEPYNNLKKIEPDFFIKGYEYLDLTSNKKTKIESEIVKGYGGEMIFSPGDIIFSSSKIIKNFKPDLKYEKLKYLMESQNLNFKNLYESLEEKNKKVKIHVVGDTIVDGYTYCSMIGGMTKTPTPSVKIDTTNKFVGGAAVVAKHMASAGADVIFSTVVGKDDNSNFVKKSLEKSGVKVNMIYSEFKPTTYKNAIIAQDYKLIKIDNVDNTPINSIELEQLQDLIKNSKADSVVFADFRHGIFNRQSIPILSKSIGRKVFKVADSQVASRWGNILEFKNFDLITPNEREARFALADQDSIIRPLALELYKKTKCRILILKCGERGSLTFTSDKATAKSFFNLDSFTNKVIDPVGAGDALLAYSTYSYIQTKSPYVSSIIGSIAASLECETDGNIPILKSEVIKRINEIEKIVS